MPSQSRHSSGAVGAQAPPRTSDHAHRRPHRDRTAAAAGAGPRARPSTSSSPSTTRRPTSARASGACTPTSARASRSPGGSRSPTTPARTARWSSRRARRASSPDVRVVTARAEGARARAAGGLVGERRDRRWPTWTSTSPPTSTRCCRSSPRSSRGTATSPSAAGWPARRAVVRGPKREVISRCYNLLLRPTLRARFPTRSAASRRSRRPRARACCRGRGHRLVLRHRAARARGATRPAHPRGARRLGRRPRQPGRHRRDRRRRPAGHRPAGPRPRHRAAAGRPDARPDRRGRPRARLRRQALRFGVSAWPAPSPTSSSSCCCAAAAGLRAQRARTARSPRSPTPPPTGASRSGCAAAAASRGTSAGPGAVRRRPRAHSGALAALHAVSPTAAARGRGRRAGGRPTSSRRRCGSSPSAPGSSAPGSTVAPAPTDPSRRCPLPDGRPALDPRLHPTRPPAEGLLTRGARGPARAGRGPRCSACWSAPRCSTSGASAPRAGPTPSTRPPCRPGTKSWKAFFFGSLDASNAITVDKPPASLWVMELSARIFGVNSWSILVPQALEGVAAVGLLYATVRRVVRGRRGAPRRRRAGADAGRRAHVPVRQPRRAARAAARRGRVRAGARARGGLDPLAAARRRPGRVRLPRQDAAGVPRRAGVRPRLPARRPDAAAAPDRAAARRRRRR